MFIIIHFITISGISFCFPTMFSLLWNLEMVGIMVHRWLDGDFYPSFQTKIIWHEVILDILHINHKLL